VPKFKVWLLSLLVLGAGCSHPSPEAAQGEETRLKSSLEKYYPEYLAAIESENRLVLETLDWLNGNAIRAPRTQAVAEARAFMDRWARVYFVPRYMHGQLRAHRYRSAHAAAVHQRLLNGLKRRYFELHDYQRYAQYASESEMHHTPPGRLPRELDEFRSRLQFRARAIDEVGPLMKALRN
jgi:hypothetical protein